MDSPYTAAIAENHRSRHVNYTLGCTEKSDRGPMT
jgi:hypothetical protein